MHIKKLQRAHIRKFGEYTETCLQAREIILFWITQWRQNFSQFCRQMKALWKETILKAFIKFVRARNWEGIESFFRFETAHEMNWTYSVSYRLPRGTLTDEIQTEQIV